MGHVPGLPGLKTTGSSRRSGRFAISMPPPGFSEWVIAYDSQLLIFRDSVFLKVISRVFSRASLQAKTTRRDVFTRSPSAMTVRISLKSAECGGAIAPTHVIKLHTAADLYRPVSRFRTLASRISTGSPPNSCSRDGANHARGWSRARSPSAVPTLASIRFRAPVVGTGWETLPSPLFDPATEHIAFRPGDTVRFVPENE